MSLQSNLLKALGVGAAVAALSAGTALAAVATTSVNVRTGPGTGYSVIDTLRPGEYVSVRGRTAGWCAVSKSGPDGWVSCAYLANGPIRTPPPPRFGRYDRYDRFDRGPSFGFSIGPGGGGMYVSPGGPPRPWWR